MTMMSTAHPTLQPVSKKANHIHSSDVLQYYSTLKPWEALDFALLTLTTVARVPGESLLRCSGIAGGSFVYSPCSFGNRSNLKTYCLSFDSRKAVSPPLLISLDGPETHVLRVLSVMPTLSKAN